MRYLGEGLMKLFVLEDLELDLQGNSLGFKEKHMLYFG